MSGASIPSDRRRCYDANFLELSKGRPNPFVQRKSRMSFGKEELLAYMLGHRLAVVSTIGGSGSPESALVGIAVHRITTSSSTR